MTSKYYYIYILFVNHGGVKLIIKTHTQCLLTKQLIAVYLIISKTTHFHTLILVYYL